MVKSSTPKKVGAVKTEQIIYQLTRLENIFILGFTLIRKIFPKTFKIGTLNAQCLALLECQGGDLNLFP